MRKIKTNKDKKLSTIKKGIGVMGTDSDGDFIFINLKTTSLLDKTTVKVLAEIKKEYKLPIREKRPMEMTDLEKDVYNLRKDEDRQSKLIVCHDTEHPKYKAVLNEMLKMEVVAKLCGYLDMDAMVLDEEDKEMSNWERFGIQKDNHLQLCKWMISEDGLALSLGDMNALSSEIMKLKIGKKTRGEMLIDEEITQEELLEKIKLSHEELDSENEFAE